jgi:teichuronic acid biosynthesis protein TuaE
MILKKAQIAVLLNKISYLLFLLLIPSSVFRVNASIPGHDSFFLFRVLLIAITILLVLIFFLKRQLVLKRLIFIWREKNVAVFFIGWLFFSGVSYFWILNFDTYFKYNVLLSISIFFLFVLVYFIQSKKTLRVVWKLILITLALSVFVALLEIFSGFRLPGSTLINAPRSYLLFVTSFFNHPNDFASYISLTLPFLILFPLHKDYKKYKWWFLIFVVTTVFVLTFTGSKINYSATLIGGIISLLIIYKNKIRDFVAYFSVVLVIIFSIFPTLGPEIYEKILNPFDRKISEVSYNSIREGTKYEGAIKDISAESGSYEVRKKLTLNAFEIVKENPKKIVGVFSGVGAGQVEDYMSKFNNTKGVRSLHNWWLEVLVNHGIFIGLGYVIFYLWLLKEIYRKALKVNDNFLKYVNYSLAVVLIILAFTSLSPSSSVGFAPLWLTLGLAFAVNNLNRSQEYKN